MRNSDCKKRKSTNVHDDIFGRSYLYHSGFVNIHRYLNKYEKPSIDTITDFIFGFDAYGDILKLKFATIYDQMYNFSEPIHFKICMQDKGIEPHRIHQELILNENIYKCNIAGVPTYEDNILTRERIYEE